MPVVFLPLCLRLCHIFVASLRRFFHTDTITYPTFRANQPPFDHRTIRERNVLDGERSFSTLWTLDGGEFVSGKHYTRLNPSLIYLQMIAHVSIAAADLAALEMNYASSFSRHCSESLPVLFHPLLREPGYVRRASPGSG